MQNKENTLKSVSNPMWADTDTEKLTDQESKADIQAPKSKNSFARHNIVKVTIGLFAVVATISAVVGWKLLDSVQPPSSSSDQETLVSVTVLSEEEIKGEVSCFLSDENVAFGFVSKSSVSELPLVSFSLSSLSSVSPKNAKYFKGFSGFQITSTENGTEVGVVLYPLSQGEKQMKVSKQKSLTKLESSEINEISSSFIGECFIELSMGLARKGIFSNVHPSVSPLFQLSKLFYKISSENKDNTLVFDLNKINNKIVETNAIVKEIQVLNEADISTKVGAKPANENILDLVALSLEPERQAACTTSEWYRLGDGRCDTQFNNAACNFDNGDCCSRTCKNYLSLWGQNSPADGSGATHPVYGCQVSDSQTCVPSCPVKAEYRHYLGDGYCDRELNIASCGYDLGDCCDKTCVSRDYSCGTNGYSCASGARGYCQRDHCGNTDFGMCGNDDSCWRWICGDCYCHYGCQAHDKYCSCDGFFTLGCFNIFTVTCD